MTLELVNTGSELMLGRVLNTHQQWLCRQLADMGYVVNRQVAVPDTGPDIEASVREALGRADLVITTGGLGPTSDDITRDLIAQMLGRTVREDAATLARIQEFFASRKRAMPNRTRVQALVPEGAHVLTNQHGTAPGLAIEVLPNSFRPGGARSWLIMLPGPPRELRPMFLETVAPLIRRELPLAGPFVSRTLRTTGIGESVVEEKIAGPLAPLVAAGLEIGYCARIGQVDVRLAAHAGNGDAMVAQAEALVRGELGHHIFGTEDEELESVLIRELTARKQTLALAESCTGGCLANRLTNVPGASAVLLAGLVTYSNAAKQEFLGVRAETIEQHGAVSEPVAREMAEGARRRTGSDYALSITGIAGPGGGTEKKPVGTVFVGLAGAFETKVLRLFNPYDRETFKQVTSQQAMDVLRRTMFSVLLLCAAVCLLLTGCSSTNPNRKTDSGVPAHLHEPATPANVAMFRSEKTKDVLVEYDESSVNVDKIVRRAYWVDENDQRILNSKKPNFVNPASIPDLTPIPVIPETDPQATNSTEPLCAILSTNGIAFSLCSSGRVIATRDLPVYEHKSVDVGGTALAVGKGVLIVIGTVIAIAGAIALSAAIYYAFGLAQGGSSNEHY